MTQTSTPRPQISPSEGQRQARRIQRGMSLLAALLIIGTTWAPPSAFDRLMLAAMMMIVAHLVIDAMRALACDRDGNPKGGDGEVGSVRSMTARSEGVAQ